MAPTIIVYGRNQVKTRLSSVLGYVDGLDGLQNGHPAYTFVQFDLPSNAVAGDTWRKVDIYGIELATATYNGILWLSQPRSIITASSGTVTMPVFISGLCDIYLLSYRFTGWLQGGHNSTNYLSYVVNTSGITFDGDNFGVNSSTQLLSFNTSGLTQNNKGISLVYPINQKIQAIPPNSINDITNLVNTIGMSRTVIGSPNLPLQPKQTIVYSEVIT